MYYRLNGPDVTCEVFDSEVLAINLKTGSYYSLRESGVLIWVLLMQGKAAGEIAGVLVRQFPSDAATIPAAVEGFVAELEREKLIVPCGAGEASPAAGAPATPPQAATFVKPLLERYTDMQELLLLDPIHEVDVTGWPMKAPSKP